MAEWKNKLFFGDNLDILRKYIPDESVDLICLDPPAGRRREWKLKRGPGKNARRLIEQANGLH